MKPDGSKTTLPESFAHALAGLADVAKGRNFWVQVAFGLAAVLLGLAFRVSLYEWLAIFICIGLVLGGECANTALENLCDLASPQVHPLAKRAKDAAAACVLVFSLASLAVAIAIFAPRILGGLI